jgi:hypothetical protein
MKLNKRLLGMLTLIVGIILAFALIGCDLSGDNGGNGGGNGGGDTPSTITIRNNTGHWINSWWIKPSTSTNWGSANWVFLNDGESGTASLTANNVYDIRLSTDQFASGQNFIKYGVTISRGMTITFTASDFDSGQHNIPTISIQNRTGVSFDSVRIRPSVSSDWGTSFGTVSNNAQQNFTIPIPPSNFTTFDIQTSSTNPTTTYTRNNVTLTNGTVLTFTSADRDTLISGRLVIVIQNNTGHWINSWWIRPSGSTDWGSADWVFINDGESRTHSFPPTVSPGNSFDIRLSTDQFATGFNFIRTITVSEGMTIIFTASDIVP